MLRWSQSGAEPSSGEGTEGADRRDNKRDRTEQNRLLLQAKQTYVPRAPMKTRPTAALEAQKTDAYKLRDDLVEYTLRQREFESNRSTV